MALSKEKIADILKNSILKSDQVFPEPPVCTKIIGEYGDEIFSTLGNFSVLIAPPKVGKTYAAAGFVISILKKEFLYINGTLSENRNSILWVDTEQGKHEGVKILKLISREVTGDDNTQPENFYYYNFRPYNNAVKLELTDYLITNSSNIGFVVIDGVRDFVSSINNEIEATQIAEKLLKWTETKNIHILTILHQNKGDGNARGHLGTEMMNKAETVAKIERRDQDGTRVTVIKPEFVRHGEFEEFGFTVKDGRIEKVEISKGYQPKSPKPNELTVHQLQDVLSNVFSDVKAYTYSKLWQALKKALKALDIDFGDNKCKELVTYLNENNYIVHNRETKYYSCNIPV